MRYFGAYQSLIDEEVETLNEMTAKDYITIGDVLRKHRADEELIDDLCTVFAKDNPRFDKTRFMAYVLGK